MNSTGSGRGTATEVFHAFLKLGLTSFGGPIAHLGYFRDELVTRRRWLDDAGYAELVGLCQFLPGPASSQVGFALGLMRAGPLGGLAAWTAFTLPSALLMMGFAVVAGSRSGPAVDSVVHGLKLAAVAIVAQALLGMARTLTPDIRRAMIAISAGATMLFLAYPLAQVALIAAGACAGMLLCRGSPAPRADIMGWHPSRRSGALLLAIFAILLVSLPFLAAIGAWAALVGIFYRAGALVFGGGHVVLPLLQASLVPGWMSNDTFLAGYGAAQAVPGPLFTLASYLGAVAMPQATAVGASLALVAIFAPGLLLIAGLMPFRRAIASNRRVSAAIAGINAAVVGLLGAALYNPVTISALGSGLDIVIVVVGFLALQLRLAPVAIVFWSVGAALLFSH
ncbi:MAG: chromate efflux transporter [Candidatus Sphingomonas colombiensis]|nr:chromate efflux transporter [Sphingomonas sp.]WEK43203.1 MAG: chromate efflux transporter [Sphingomonas sp.]